MKLVNSEYGIEIGLSDEYVNVLIIENPVDMRRIVEELWKQCSGIEGKFVLSQGKILKIEKNMEIILNPFQLDFQNRKIMSALYAKLTEAANEYVWEKSCVNTELIKLLDKITESVNYSGITYQFDFGWQDLFKIYGVRIENQEGFLERLVEYFKVLSELCGIRIVCLVDIKKYLTKKEILDLYSNAIYNKINLLLVESQEDKVIAQEKITIIDKDLCVITK